MALIEAGWRVPVSTPYLGSRPETADRAPPPATIKLRHRLSRSGDQHQSWPCIACRAATISLPSRPQSLILIAATVSSRSPLNKKRSGRPFPLRKSCDHILSEQLSAGLCRDAFRQIRWRARTARHSEAFANVRHLAVGSLLARLRDLETDDGTFARFEAPVGDKEGIAANQLDAIFVERSIARHYSVCDQRGIKLLGKHERCLALLHAQPLNDIAAPGNNFLILLERDFDVADRALVTQPVPKHREALDRIGAAVPGDECVGVQE
ncbi:hypothetical protein CCACVL1_01359, partial [Corchorus capsularis]